MNIQKLSARHFMSFLFSLCLTLFQCSSVSGAFVDYQISYDPITEITIIHNDVSSLSAFDFHTLVGPNAFYKDFQLPPGDTVTVDRFGNVTGTFLDPIHQVCTNKIGTGKVTTVKNTGTTSVTLHPLNGPDQSLAPGQETQIDPGTKVSGKSFMIHENIITTLAETSIVFDSSSWLNPDQVNYQLISGSVDSVDDTSNFSSIFTPFVATGCVPDGTPTWWLLAIGFGGLAGLKARLRDPIQIKPYRP